MPQNPNDAPDSPQMDEVLAEFIRRRDAGEPVDVESLCAARPDLADALRSYADGEALLREMALDDSVPAGSAVAETMRPGAMRDTDSLIAGRVLGNYRLIRQLGQGAMGAVYLAEDTTLQRQAAVKVPKFSPADGSDARERFFREARAAAALNHPHICPVFHADEVQGTPFIAMAFINGQPLSRFVGTEEFLNQRRIAEVIRAVADGLQHAHERGIVHRDLKPGNIMLDQQGQPVVTDFGLARRLVQEQESRITQEGQILGTPAYMSPEQITGNLDKLTSATDVYALGVVLFELLTGRLPFQGNAPAVIAAALHTQPPKPSSLRADVDPELETLCLQMLRKDVPQRPKSMREVSDRLAKWLEKPAPPSAAEQAVAKQLRTELEGEQQKIKQLIRSGQFQTAMKQLQALALRNEPAAVDFKQWAAEQIPRVKALPAKMKRDEPEMVRMAQDWMKRHDYEQAIQILRSIPDLCRSDETEELLQQAVELQEESDDLLLHLKNCVQKRQYDGIEADAKRLLELKPGNQFAKNLWEKLHSYRGVPASSRRYRFDNKGRLLPMNDGSDWTRNLILAGLTGLLVFGLLTWGIVIYLRNDDQTLAVEVDDEWLKEQGGQLTLAVDGKEHHLTGPGFDIKVALGDRGFSVKNGDSVIHNPQTFTIAKAGRQVLRIDGSGMRFGVQELTAASSDAPSADIALEEILAYEFTEQDQKDWHATALAVSPEGRVIYVSNTRTPGTWKFDVSTGGSRVQLSPVSGTIGIGGSHDMDISPDGSILAFPICCGILDMFDLDPLKHRKRLVFSDTSGQLGAVRISPDGRWVGAAMVKGRAALWELATGRLVKEFPAASDNGFTLKVCFTHDSKEMIVSGQGGDNRRFYRVVTETGELTEQSSATLSGSGPFVLSGDGRAVLSQYHTQSYHIAESQNWARQRSLGASGDQSAVDWSPDSRLIATSITSRNGVAIFDGQTYARIRDIEIDGFDVEKLRFSKDSRVLAAAGMITSRDGKSKRLAVRAWKLRTESTEGSASAITIDAPRTPLPDGPPGFVRTLDGHTGIVTGLGFAPDGRTLVSVSATDGMLRIWDIESGETRHAIKVGIGYGTAIHPDGKSVLVSILDYGGNHPILYDINTGEVLAKFPGLGGPAYSCGFSPNGKYAAFETDKHGVKVYDVSDLTTQSLVAEFSGGASGWASAIQFLPDNEHLIESTFSGTRLFHVPSKREVRRYLSDGKPSGTTSKTIAVRPDGKHFFMRGSVNWEVVGYDVAQETPVERFANVRDFPRYSPDGLHLIGVQDHDPKAGTPLTLTVRSPSSGATVWQASLLEKSQPLGMNLTAVSPDGRYVVLAGMSDVSQNGATTIKGLPNPLYLWRLPPSVWPKLKSEEIGASPEIILDVPLTPLPDGPPGLAGKLHGHAGYVHNVRFAPDGRTVLSVGADDAELRIWDIESGNTRHLIKTGAARALAVHPGGDFVAVNTSNGTKFFDLKSGSELATIPPLQQPARSMDVSPDGKYLAIHSHSGAGVTVWDVSSLANITRHSGFDGGGKQSLESAVQFLPDSQHLLVSSWEADYAVRLFHIPTSQEVRAYTTKDGLPEFNPINWITLHPNGKQFCVWGGRTRFPMLFDLNSPTSLRQFPIREGLPVFSPDGRHLICGHWKLNQIQVYSTDSGDLIWHTPTENQVPRHVAISPDGRFIVTSHRGVEDKASISESTYELLIWRLPKEVWPKLNAEGSLQVK